MTGKTKFILLALSLLIFQKWEYIDNFFNPLGPSSSILTENKVNFDEHPVIFFSKSWCGWCNKTRKLLDENNIRYIEYDIEISTKGRKWHSEVGGKGVPVLIIGDYVKHGYNRKKILKLIN